MTNIKGRRPSLCSRFISDPVDSVALDKALMLSEPLSLYKMSSTGLSLKCQILPFKGHLSLSFTLGRVPRLPPVLRLCWRPPRAGTQEQGRNSSTPAPLSSLDAFLCLPLTKETVHLSPLDPVQLLMGEEEAQE